jgi:hypothetical protein
MKLHLLGAVCASIFTISVTSTSHSATVFTDRTQFEQAAGVSLQLQNFDDFPTNTSGFGAFTNGQAFSGDAFSIESLTLDNDITLLPSGLTGTFQVHTSGDASIGKWASPGSTGGVSDPADDDDFHISFAKPLTAFGMLIMDSRPEASEGLTLFSEDGSEVISAPLPGIPSGTGANGFLGFVLDPGDALIKTVEVLEGQTLNDDIGFDLVYFAPVPLPPAVWLFGSGLVGLVGIARRKVT